MKRIIVSDTTCLIILEKLNRIDLLCHLFDQVLLPTVVFKEWLGGNKHDENWLNNFKCIQQKKVQSSTRLNSLLMILDQGEAHAIELACVNNIPLIIDESKGRKIATQVDVDVIGFVGIVIQAYRVRYIDSKIAKSLINDSLTFGFRLSEVLFKQVMSELEKPKYRASLQGKVT